MSMERVFPGIEDFLALTAAGQVGRFEPGGGFRVFEQLSSNVAEYARRLLEAHARSPSDADIRPAILLPASSDRAWRSASLVLDDVVVHRLFPSTGVHSGLTRFQQRNRVRSIYQGMELLIGYQNKSMPGLAFYCPVLHGTGSTLRDYPDHAQALADEVAGDTPVLEVLNLIAMLSPGERKGERASDLVRLVQDISIQTSRRAEMRFTIG